MAYQTPNLIPIIIIDTLQYMNDVDTCRRNADCHGYALGFRVKTNDDPHTHDFETDDEEQALAEYRQRITAGKLQTCLYAEYLYKAYESDGYLVDPTCLIGFPTQREDHFPLIISW